MKTKACILNAEVDAEVIGAWLGACLTKLLGTAFAKWSSNRLVGRSLAGYALFLIVSGITACTFFFIMGGFRIHVTTDTMWFSLIFAVICIGSSLTNVVAFRLVDIAGVTVLQNAGSLVGSSVLGVLLFSETMNTVGIVRVGLMLAAIWMIFLSKRSATMSDKHVRQKPFLVILLALVQASWSCASIVVQKYYALASDVADSNSFFFWANVVMVALALPFLAIKRHDQPADPPLAAVGQVKQWVSFAGNTLCSNVAALLSMFLIARMDVSVYTAIASSLGILCGVCGSILFREKLNIFSFLAVGLAASAIIL